MILVIPSIELSEGICKYNIIGEHGTGEFYTSLSNNPDELCKLLRRENSKSLHLIDNGTFNIYKDIDISSISFIVQSVDIPIKVYANYNKIEDCISLFNCGVFRVVIDDLLINDSYGVMKLIEEYTNSRIIFNLRLDDSCNVIFKNINRKIHIYDYINLIKKLGGNRIILSHKHWEDENIGFRKEDIVKYCGFSGLRVTIGNGINNYQQLFTLNESGHCGIDSVLLGKPLFENKFPCQKIWRIIEAELEL